MQRGPSSRVEENTDCYCAQTVHRPKKSYEGFTSIPTFFLFVIYLLTCLIPRLTHILVITYTSLLAQ